MKARAHIYIRGKVQGVFFRARIIERSVRLGVNGWVRNLLDGRVEAVFEGENDKVIEIVDFRRCGPRGSLVTGLDLTWEQVTGEFQDFKVLHQNSL